jgi:hypothetical protein
MKTSRWKRRDRDTGLWIASSKPVFAYWFRFLIHAENDPDYEVDWSLYEEWGGRDYILHTKQNDWWKAKWKTLFGYKEGETEPLYRLSTGPEGRSKPQANGIRLSLMVYDLKDKPLLNGQIDEVNGLKGNKWEIAKRIALVEYPKRRNTGAEDPSFDPEDWQFNIARAVIARRMTKEDPAEFRKQKRTLQSRIGRYMRQAEKHLDNVCKGQFP